MCLYIVQRDLHPAPSCLLLQPHIYSCLVLLSCCEHRYFLGEDYRSTKVQKSEQKPGTFFCWKLSFDDRFVFRCQSAATRVSRVRPWRPSHVSSDLQTSVNIAGWAQRRVAVITSFFEVLHPWKPEILKTNSRPRVAIMWPLRSCIVSQQRSRAALSRRVRVFFCHQTQKLLISLKSRDGACGPLRSASLSSSCRQKRYQSGVFNYSKHICSNDIQSYLPPLCDDTLAPQSSLLLRPHAAAENNQWNDVYCVWMGGKCAFTAFSSIILYHPL